MTDAITREEKLMEAMATGSPSNIKPITREEMFLAKAGGQDVQTPEPITRREKLLQGIIDNGGGGGSKPEGTIQITENGTHDVTEYASAEVMVSDGGDDVLNAVIDRSITEINSNVEIVGSNAFRNCKKLTSANIPSATRIEGNAFMNCNLLGDINFPIVEEIGDNGFDSCGQLKTINFPLVTKIGSYVFQSCNSLTKVVLPSLTTAGNIPFNQSESLKFIDFGLIKNIGSNYFATSSIDTLILRNSSIVTLSNVSAFKKNNSDTPFTVVCPQSLIEGYKIATNWSTLYTAGTCTFLPIEGSEFE